MAKEIIINAEKAQTQIAIVEDGTLAELHVEHATSERTVGDIYLGQIRRLVPSIKAAFVDIGQSQDAFLHYTDLDENLAQLLSYAQEEAPHLRDNPPQLAAPKPNRSARPGRKRRTHGSLDLLKKNQRILVQVVKEPISTKGTRVSTRVSLAGRFLVLVPVADLTAVSRKISSQKERRRLRTLVQQLRPAGFGIIVRTVARGKDRAALETDLKLLLKRWRQLEKQIAGTDKVPAKVHTDVNMVSSIIRDLFSNDYDRILVDEPRMHRNIQRYIQAVAPHLARVVKLHKDSRPIFQATELQSTIEDAFSQSVQLPSGGYLVIEQTEAMHVIDVNSGSGRQTRNMSHEAYALKVNLEAARAVARQTRLRDLGGIIVVDFIDMRDMKDRQKVFEVLKEGFQSDRAATKVLPMSDICLIQITRQRTRPSIKARDESASDEALRNGHASPRDLVASMEAWLGAHCNGSSGKLFLHVHPFTAAYLKRGVPSLWLQWQLRHKVRIVLKEKSRMNVMGYSFELPSASRQKRAAVDVSQQRRGSGERGKQSRKRPAKAAKEDAA